MLATLPTFGFWWVGMDCDDRGNCRVFSGCEELRMWFRLVLHAHERLVPLSVEMTAVSSKHKAPASRKRKLRTSTLRALR